MNLEGTEDSASRFAAYIEELTSVIGHADRARPMNDYCAGLLVTEGRRSVEPIAGVTAPDKTSVQHQKLLHFVAEAPWSDEPVLVKVREMVVPAIKRHKPIEDWIIDDTSFPKCGSKSVGVQHQYCGQLGKQANCQVAVTLSIANHHASLPIGYRLYLPQEWAKNAARRKKARIPKEISFKTKPQIALEQIAKSLAAGVPRGVVLTDASYGSNSGFRTGLSGLGLEYVAAIRGAAARGEETLLIEWPKGEREPTKYWLATLDKNISFRALVDRAKMRWRIERDYLELKQEIGLGHYEGRGWPGFHHHATLCIAVYGFLISERETIPPSGPHCAWRIKKLAIPASRPHCASDPTPTSRSQLNRYAPSSVDVRDRKDAPTMSLLYNPIQKEHASDF